VRAPRTLRTRLALVAVLATAGWVVALTIVFNVMLGNQLRTQADDLLRTRAAAAVSTLDVRPGGALVVREPRHDAALDAGVWIYQGRRAIDRAPAAAAVQRAADAMARGGGGFAQVGSPTTAVRLFGQPVLRKGKRVATVVTAESLEPYRRTSQTALVASVALAMLLVASVYLVTRAVVARALSPVARMAEQAAQWSAHDVAHRFGAAPRPGELRDLAVSLDALLDRIASVLRHERQLAAELSHELRTPLAVIAGENELLQSAARTEGERVRASAVIAESADRMGRLLDTLLAQAAQEVTEAPGQCLVDPVVRRALAESGIAGLDISVEVPAGLEVGASAEVLERILAPLLGNAGRYARSRVAVMAARVAGRVEIEVVDDGPGVPEEFRDHVFEPGRRADPQDGHAGAGLGLALARRLARAAEGDITLEEGRPGGAAFLVVLPAG
jgi:signal transduction histidine kinase